MSLSHIYKQLRNYFRSPNDDSLPGEQVSCSASTVRLQYDVRRFTTKVSDFGLSRLLPDHSPKLGSNAEYTGTITHMAPELLEHGGMSRAADVYSFGVLSIPPPPPLPLMSCSLPPPFCAGSPYAALGCCLGGWSAPPPAFLLQIPHLCAASLEPPPGQRIV